MKRLGVKQLRFRPQSQPLLILLQVIKPARDIQNFFRDKTVITPAVAIGRITRGAPFGHGQVGRGRKSADGVDVGHQDVGGARIIGEVVVLAVEDQGDGVVGVGLGDGVVGEQGEGEGGLPAVWSVGGKKWC